MCGINTPYYVLEIKICGGELQKLLDQYWGRTCSQFKEGSRKIDRQLFCIRQKVRFQWAREWSHDATYQLQVAKGGLNRQDEVAGRVVIVWLHWMRIILSDLSMANGGRNISGKALLPVINFQGRHLWRLSTYLDICHNNQNADCQRCGVLFLIYFPWYPFKRSDVRLDGTDFRV